MVAQTVAAWLVLAAIGWLFNFLSHRSNIRNREAIILRAASLPPGERDLLLDIVRADFFEETGRSFCYLVATITGVLAAGGVLVPEMVPAESREVLSLLLVLQLLIFVANSGIAYWRGETRLRRLELSDT